MSTRMLSALIFILLCDICASDEPTFDIRDIEDKAVLADFDNYPLVSEEKRPSTICPVRQFEKYKNIYLIYVQS